MIFGLFAAICLGLGADGGFAAPSKALGGEPSLREAAVGLFPIGVGLNDKISSKPLDIDLVRAQFSHLTPENCMKVVETQPQEGVFNFSLPDGFVDFAAANKLEVCGHCLVWAKDDRTPAWFFREGDKSADKTLLLQRMRQHIQSVAGRYKGRIASWDVVNEAIDDGEGYIRPSGWSRIAGDDFIAKAFEYAHEADPAALLIYNDYNTEAPVKRAKMERLVRSLQERKAPLYAVGLQGHWELDSVPFKDIEDTLVAMKKLGVKVVISELDIDVVPRSQWWAENGKYRDELAKVDPYRAGCPPEILRRQAEQYAALFRIFVRHKESIARITFWNLHDGQSWLNGFPWKRANYPLLFDREGKPKPALDAVIRALRGEPGSEEPKGGGKDTTR